MLLTSTYTAYLTPKYTKAKVLHTQDKHYSSAASQSSAAAL